MFGGTAGGKIMSILVIISGFGALTGWTMICAEMPLAAANDGLFPERFKRMNKAGVPAFGIIASTTLASIAMVINYLGSSGANAFTTLVLMTGHHRPRSRMDSRRSLRSSGGAPISASSRLRASCAT